jgi:hypothetical protein
VSYTGKSLLASHLSFVAHLICQPRPEYYDPVDGDMSPLIPSVMHSLMEMGHCESPFHNNSRRKMPAVFLVEIKIGGMRSPYKCAWCFLCW